MIDFREPALSADLFRRIRHLCSSPVLRCGLLAALSLSLCHCAGKGYKAANYSPEKLATPAHNLSQRDYPFDADGNYRKDWVTRGSRTVSGNGVSSRRSSSSGTTASSSTASRSSSASAPPARITPPQTVASAPRPAAPRPKPQPKPKPAARYHTVQAGQTLWAISQKYKVSVSALKRANGLRSDLIRVGQSLRIP